ncbi:MAG TPA: type II toxin-antitoxin system VapC family toxin [Caulobacter sp.]|nr:type II toxin-antitoxin system VapC family toxin [Caulobacter sp.]
MSAYLDASVILPTLIEEAASAVVDRFMDELEDDLIVSEFAAAEVASALSRLVRTGLMDHEDANRRLADFDAWRAAATRDLDLQASDVRLANVFVRRFDLMLRAPDALHAAVCRREDHLLVTLDKRLAAAALELGVRTQLLV